MEVFGFVKIPEACEKNGLKLSSLAMTGIIAFSCCKTFPKKQNVCTRGLGWDLMLQGMWAGRF